MRKGEIACYKQFLLFSKFFPQLYILSASKCDIVWSWVNKKNMTSYEIYFNFHPTSVWLFLILDLAEWSEPTGGMFLWLKLKVPDTFKMITVKARAKEVLFVPGNAFQLDDSLPSPHVRASYSLCTEEQMNKVISALRSLKEKHLPQTVCRKHLNWTHHLPRTFFSMVAIDVFTWLPLVGNGKLFCMYLRLVIVHFFLNHIKYKNSVNNELLDRLIYVKFTIT